MAQSSIASPGAQPALVESATPGPVAVPPARLPGGRTVLVAAIVAVSMQSEQSGHPLASALALTALLVLSVLAVLGRLPRLSTIGPRATTALGQALVSVAVLRAGLYEIGLEIDAPHLVAAGLVLVAVATALAVVWLPHSRPAKLAFCALLVAQAAYLGLLIDVTPYLSDDVGRYVVGGLHRLAHGHAAYGGSIANPYDASETAKWVSPQLVQGDRILIGFPYLPGILLVELPGHLLGDYRYVHLAAVVLLAIVWRRLAVDRLGRALAVLAVMSPYTARLAASGWVEPPIMLGLALLALAVRRGWRLRGALALAFLLASKQYFAFVLPFVIPLWRRWGWRTVLGAALGAGALVLVFLAWAPGGFLHDVVRTQLLQPYRPDSISLVVALGNRYGVPPAWALTVLPLVGGLVVSTLVAARTRPGATATAAATGLGLFAVLLLSKQAFFNYFALVEAGLVTAAIAWAFDGPGASWDPGDAPDPTPVPAAAES